ncbi:MAG: hypothetical protein ABI024_13830 [Vicinamibacterales bacterium]
MRRLLLTVALSVVIVAPAVAQQPLKLSFQDGRVTVDATSVPVRTILTEWGKVGGTKVVGAERITGAPITLKLVNVTEAQALETILRSVAGYMAAPRNGATTGPSIYDRILVMATSSAPAPVNAARPSPAQPNAFAGTQRFVAPRQRPEQVEQDEIEEPDDNPPSPPVFTFPPPQNMAYPQQPGAFGNVPAGVAQPGMIVPAPQSITINPAQGNVPQPQMPVGVSQPGMMVPAPQPRQPTQPVIVHPPGAN